VIDENKVVISEPQFFQANEHDAKTLEQTIDHIPIALRTDNRRTLKLAGDKAYRSKRIAQLLFREKKIRLIAEPKSNERNPQPIAKKDKTMFKKRIYIEHLFGMIKRWKRIRNRNDGFVSHYRSFWLFALTRMTFNKLYEDITSHP
jgi:hypothetical protein